MYVVFYISGRGANAPTNTHRPTNWRTILIPTKKLLALAALASLSLGHCAHAQHATEGAQGETITLDAQGGDYPEWFQNPHMVEFYALSVEMLRANVGRVDA